ncbi:hypothetical protein CBR_g18824 [Chara braunii]|uniref:Integrase catalytic domain-containing protein n=1 Tax=Chara braunii TaxID=69332 RepID=A0A388KWS8_CHABU|nr:hypothetical protein CBR_g18824 [Chara braunii]|eukprot:GBG74413.1 hypothetical protein CBR_g18824 [Chara braunii]
MSDGEDTREDDRILRSARRPVAHLALGREGDRYLFHQRTERQQQQRARAEEASRAFVSEAAASATMATSAQQSSQASSSGSVGSTVAQTLSHSTSVMASQPIVLTSDEIAIQQATLQEAQLQKALGEIKAEKERMIRRRAKMQRRQADVSELEEMDLTHVTDDGRTIRSVLLNVVEMQDHQTTILQDIQQSLALLAGRAQAAPSMSGSGASPVVQPPPFVPPVTGVSPYVAPSSVAIVSLACRYQEGSQQGPGQTQWVPKTAIVAPKPFTGDKRGEDLDTWLRAVSVYVKCKLTLPHEEVLVAASYLEGSAARWLSSLVQLQGYGHDFRAWAVTQQLDDFLKLVEERWHDPQEAQNATGVILTLHTRQFKSVSEATDAIERLICVPGVRYDPQVLLTSYLRCFPMPLRNQLAGEANINVHNFPSFSKKALDLEAKIGHGQAPTTDGRKKTLPPNWKAKGRIMFVDKDGSTIELYDNFQEGVGSEAGSVEASGGGVVAAVAQKDECEAAFRHLKDALTHYEVLKLPDPDKPFVVTTDASQYGIGAVLAQQEGPKLRPVEYMSKKMSSQKLAKSTNEKELYAVYKALTHWRHYLLGRPGGSLSMDFMDTLVTSKSGRRHIFVIVDRFSKYARLIAMPETANTEYVIRLFKENWVRDFGLPKSIVSDRDIRFTSEMWKAAAAEQGTQLQMTSGNHPKANGQAEQLNRAVQHLLRHYIKPNQVDWDEKLALIASLYNNAVHSATGVSPNSLLLTFKPRLPLDFLLPENQLTAAPGTLEFAYRLGTESVLRTGKGVRDFPQLMPQYFGPWEVLDIVGTDPDGPSYVIRIPGHLRTYPAFHASKLAPFTETDQFPSRRSMLPPTMDGEVDIDDIVDHRELPVPRPTGRGRPPKPKLQYRVRFRHHTNPKEDRWFTREGLMQTTPQVVAHYEKSLQKGKRPMIED